MSLFGVNRPGTQNRLEPLGHYSSRSRIELKESADRHQAAWTGMLVLLSLVAAYGIAQRTFHLSRETSSMLHAPSPSQECGQGMCLRGSLHEM